MDTKSKQVFISYHTETGKDAVRTICAIHCGGDSGMQGVFTGTQ